MVPTDQEIQDNVAKLSKLGAPDEYIAKYVDTARSEQAAVVGRKKFTQDDISGFVTGAKEYVKETPSQVGQMSTTTGLTEEQFARRQASGQAALQALERDFGAVGGAAIEIAAPIAVTLATGGVGLPAAIALRAASGAGSTAVRQFLTGADVFSAQGANEMLQSAILAGAPIPTFGSGVKEIAKSGATIGGIAGGASLAGQLTEKALRSEKEQYKLSSRLAEIESSEGALIAKNALRAGFGGFGFGSALHALGSAFGKFAENRAQIDASRRYFEEAGVQPTYGMLQPDRAGLERTVAQSRPELAAKIDAAPSSVFRSFWEKLGDVPDNAAMQARFKDIIPAIDNAEKLVLTAQDDLAKARLQLDEAKAGRLAVTAEEMAALEADAAAKELNAISVTAAAENKIVKMQGDAVGPTEHANIVTGNLKKLNEAVSNTTKSLYSKTGLNPEQGVISRDAVVEAAERALKRVGATDTNYGQAILGAVKGKTAEELAPEEKQLRAMFGEPVSDAVSWSEYQGLRTEMGNRFGGIEPGQMNAANNAASAVYREIGDTLMKHFESTPALKSAAAPLRTAMDFYRDISQIRDSNIGSELFRIPIFLDPASPQFRIAGVQASSLTSIAEALRRGDTDTLNQLYTMVSKLSKYSPEVGQSLVTAVHAAMRDNYLSKKGANSLSILDDLLETARTQDMVPFVESLGFGSISRIKQMKEGFKTYKPEEITSDVIDSVLTNPDIKTGIDRAVFDARVKAAALLAASKDTAGARAKLAEAIKIADKAGVDEAKAVQMFNDYQNNDLYAAFSGLGNYSLSAEAGKTGQGTITHLIKQMPESVAVKAMAQLRKTDSNMADLVSRKMWADELQSIIRTERWVPGETAMFDLSMFNRLFNSKNPNDIQRLKFMRSVAGSAITSDMERFIKSVSRVEEDLRKGKYVTEVNVEKLSTAANVAGAAGIPMGELGPLGLTALTRRVARAMRGGYYDFLVYLATDKNLAKNVATANSIVDALKKEPVQRMYLYYSNGRLMRDLALLDIDERQARQGQPTR